MVIKRIILEVEAEFDTETWNIRPVKGWSAGIRDAMDNYVEGNQLPEERPAGRNKAGKRAGRKRAWYLNYSKGDHPLKPLPEYEVREFTGAGGINGVYEIAEWCGGEAEFVQPERPLLDHWVIRVPTSEGVTDARVGDIIFKGAPGEFYILPSHVLTALNPEKEEDDDVS